jgi:hypothetical protein
MPPLDRSTLQEANRHQATLPATYTPPTARPGAAPNGVARTQEKGSATANASAHPGEASGPLHSGPAVHPNDLPTPERAPSPNTGSPQLDKKYQRQQATLVASNSKSDNTFRLNKSKNTSAWHSRKLAKGSALGSGRVGNRRVARLHRPWNMTIESRGFFVCRESAEH